MKAVLSLPFIRQSFWIFACVGAALLIFLGFGDRLFRADAFLPHATCYLQDPALIWLHVSTDVVIGVAYVSISAMLGYLVVRASENIPFHWMFLAFGLFIVSCGFTHFMEVWTVWKPVYWLSGYVKLVTAAASLATAIALVPLIPKIFQLVNAVRVSEERRVKLEQANEELEAFAGSVAHDLRTPLRAVHGRAEVLREDYGGQLPAGAMEHLDEIGGAIARMEKLIQDLLEYSRVSRESFVLEPVSLAEVVEEARLLLGSDSQARKAQVVVTNGFPTIIGNRVLLVQIVANLLSNAVKFIPSDRNPQVEITGKAMDAGHYVLRVQDNGIGIRPEDQARIFRLFERLHTRSEYPGTGLGLAIVQRAVQRLGGRLGVESEFGKGSCFWVEFRTS